jgi:hypothetical protein
MQTPSCPPSPPSPSTDHVDSALHVDTDREPTLQLPASLVTSPSNLASLVCGFAAAKKRKRTSGVWLYFDRSGGYAHCKHCDTRYVYKGNSTGNLWRHMRTEHSSLLDAVVDPQNRPLAEGARAVPYSDERFREWLLHWIVSEAMPFTAIEASSFRRLLRLLKPDVPLPSATAHREARSPLRTVWHPKARGSHGREDSLELDLQDAAAC